MNNDFLLKISSLLIENCINNKTVQFAILFGSILSERFNDDSDIDIGIMVDNDVDYKKVQNELFVQIFSKIGREPDIIVLNTADIIITMQILSNGKLIYYQDIEKYYNYKAKKIGEYLDFKQSRKWLEENFLKNRIYARK